MSHKENAAFCSLVFLPAFIAGWLINKSAQVCDNLSAP
jgi:hypothetical protein